MPRTNLASDAVMAALTHFISLRRAGHNRDEAWYKVIDSAKLETGDEVELLTLAKKWEQREGNKYINRTPQPNSDATLLRPANLPQPVQTTPGNIAPRPAAAPTNYLDPNILAQYEAALKGSNVPFNTAPLPKSDTTPYEVAVPLPPAQAMHVVIYFRDFPNTFQFDLPDGKEVIVGRNTPESPMAPDIDLTPLRGGELGISRIHATLERRGDLLYLSDLDSRNHTYIGQERVMPHEIRALKNGDYVWFGRMLTQIQYRLG
jgi:hypothetical protein